MWIHSKIKKISLILLIGIFLATGCSPNTADNSKESFKGNFSAWVPYWDAKDALLEAHIFSSSLDSVVAFAAFLNPEGRVLIPKATKSCFQELQKEECDLFLSFTNDVVQADGSYLEKDVAILKSLLENEDTTAAHIEELIALTEEYGADGIEIDYENIKKDTELWADFVFFVEQMEQASQQAGLRLRVVLPWDAPKYAVFPKGPEYVVMCYNLYGTHSGPGPKADREFLLNAFKLSRDLQGEPAMALASGGFDWSGDGAIKALTQVEAEELAEKYQVDKMRDETSRCLVFEYNEGGIGHEVWFADGETLAYWISLAQENGYFSIDIWRLGGNVNSDLKKLFN